MFFSQFVFRYYSADSVAGLIIYEDKYAYSHHATDPVQGKALNAFDLVRLHLFGTLDDNINQSTKYTDLPSYKAMCNLARDEGVVKNEYSPVTSESDTNLLTKLENALKTDPLLQNIRYNENSGQIDVKGYPAWLSGNGSDNQKTYPWNSMLNCAPKNNYIVRTINGTPYSNLSAINRVVNRLTDNAGLPHCTIHGFRHTVASILDDNGVSIQEISVLLGHENVSTTEKVHIHRNRKAKAENIDLLENVINQAGETADAS